MLVPAYLPPSHPVRVRGLKRQEAVKNAEQIRSHPVRVRGLKPGHHDLAGNPVLSHPVRVRGLKRAAIAEGNDELSVAPRAGAWVETTN